VDPTIPQEHRPLTLSLATGLGLFLLSLATLTFEIDLTRLFSVTQFYHFAFMIVSVALLGFGASGTVLMILSSNTRFYTTAPARYQYRLAWLALLTGLCILGSYLLTNWVSFDSFSIAWDRKQSIILIIHYVALALPFFFSGMSVSFLLALYPEKSGLLYSINLIGSALGCIIALIAPSSLGGEGTLVLSAGLASAAAVIFSIKAYYIDKIPLLENALYRSKIPHRSKLPVSLFWCLTVLVLMASLLDVGLLLSGHRGLIPFTIRLSPYKSLSYALQYPNAKVIFQRWNAFSRVDVVRSPGIRSLPGLSYSYQGLPPSENGLFVDGDDLSPVILPDEDSSFANYLPSAVAFNLRPDANTLILGPRGGLDIVSALALGASQVTAAEDNPLIVEASSSIYANPRVQLVNESDRSYLRRSGKQFDLIVLSLVNSYHPVRSGAYSLAEDYRYTVQSFIDAIARLSPEGLLVVTRWLQIPPSEDLRTLVLAVTALDHIKGDPKTQIVAFRGYTTATFLVKKSPFTSKELQDIRTFIDKEDFDLSYAPDIQADEVNKHNILPDPVYYRAYLELINTKPRQAFYTEYPYDVSPSTDDRPFFNHFFKWSQAGQVLSELGKTWQPFGGAGYFAILALLSLAVVLSVVSIFLPVLVIRQRFARLDLFTTKNTKAWGLLFYFGLIGLAYLFTEIPFIQQFILYLNHPAYAMTAVLFTLLLFSGLGSLFSSRIPMGWAMITLGILIVGLPVLLPHLFNLTLGLPLALRLCLTVLVLGPVGFLMGIPFPGGLHYLLRGIEHSQLTPWIWAINGSASVIAAVLSAMLALSFGFTWVLRLGAICYVGAYLTAKVSLTVPASPLLQSKAQR
jgi:hypothetical protein